VSEDAEADAYVLDGETFGALRRLAGKLRGDSLLAGDERRNLANRMNALLQKARPQHAREARQKASAEDSSASDSLSNSFWTLRSQQSGKM
jgi:hypothetical protein